MGSYEKIRQEIENIPWIDSHSHVLHWNIDKNQSTGRYKVQPLAALLLDFNNRLTYMAAGMSQQVIQDILAGNMSPEHQKKEILSYPSVQNHIAYIYLMRGIRELYGIDIWCVSEKNWDIVNHAIEKAHQDFYSLLKKTYKNGNIKASILNLWADKGYRYVGNYRDSLLQDDSEIDKQSFWFSATFDFRAMLPFASLTMRYASDFGMELENIDDYEALLCRTAQYLVEEKGALGFKITEMYFRRLDYTIVEKEQAAACFKKDRTPEQEKILSDFVACTVFRLAAQYNIPVQIHTGSRWGDFAIFDVNPAYLSDVIKTFKHTKFELLHGGDPYFGESAALAEAYPNVYLNLSSLPLNSYDLCIEWLGRYLDKLPCNKISLGWDVFQPEIVCGAAHFTRDIVAEVLARKIDRGLYSYDQGIEVAHWIMHKTSEQLYRRKANA